MYPQPTAVMDPNWYYQQMLLYQGYMPAAQYAAAAAAGHMMQPSPMFPFGQRYSVTPGKNETNCTCTEWSAVLRIERYSPSVCWVIE